jgi:DsbC/DsbD-like thiol-disulfide interchange protein
MGKLRQSSGLFWALASGVGLLWPTPRAVAATTPIPHGSLELIAEKEWIETQSLADGAKFDVGLYFQLEQGWHIYWVNPGDSGEPPRVDWHLHGGLSAGAIEWPTPRRLEDSSSVVDYGYEDSVLLIVPMQVDPKLAAESSIQIGADVKLLVCSHDMCIPAKAQLSLAIPIKTHLSSAPNSRYGDLFVTTRKSFPRPAPITWKFSVTNVKDSFVLTANLGRQIAGRPITNYQITHAVFLPLAESQIQNAAPQQFVVFPTGFRLTLRKSDQLQKPIARLKGVIVLSGEKTTMYPCYLIDAPVSLNISH